MSDSAARRCVIRVLGDYDVSPINFTIHGVRITAQGIRRVLALVRSGRFVVRFIPRARVDDGDAEYNSNTNTFILRFTRVRGNSWRGWTQQALIVHEATHALCDPDSHTHMHVDTSEAAGYIVQCVFLRALVRDGTPNVPGHHRDPGQERAR